jgi:hypothetical protein
LGARFADDKSWRTWFAVLKAAYGRVLTKAELAAFARVAGGRKPPRRKVRELICVVSRRGGKGSVAGAIGAYESALVHHDLAPGERGIVACISPTRAQAQIVADYCAGFFTSSPILRGEIADTTADELRLRSGVVVTTLAADYRSLRGRTLLLAVLDEGAFLADDLECVRALQPGLATTNGMLIVLSSPFRRSGFLFERHRDYFGRDDDDVLVVAGPSELFNPTLDPKMLAAARAADPEGAAAEWGGEFRSDSGSLFDDATIESAIDRARPLELPPRPNVKYFAHVDAAGGASGGDAYTLAIGHRAGDDLIIDLVRGAVGKFDPEQVTADYASMLRAYKIESVVGDHFAAGWVEAVWRSHGIGYRASDQNRSEIYLDCVPLFVRGVVQLPDHARMLRELRLLERRTGRNGRESVDHPRGGSDDFANVVCGVVRAANVAAPSLWQRELLLVGDGAAILPKWADVLFCVAVTGGEHGIAVTYFCYRAANSPALVLLDFDELPISAPAFHEIIGRLWRHVEAIPACAATVFTQSMLATEFERAGYGKAVEIIDTIAADELLSVSAARHINSGRIKLSPQARARAETLPLGILDGTTADNANPLRLSALSGIAIALDPGRKLGTRRAA